MKQLLRAQFFVIGALALATSIGSGCGGSSGGNVLNSTTGSTQAAVSLTVDHSTITPGQTANLSWSSQNASSVVTSNIAATTVNGTLAVTPTFSSDYTITVAGSGTNTSTVHVTVNRPTPRFVLVGSSSDPDVPQIQALLQKLGSVTVQSSMPTSTASYDAVVMHPSGSISPTDAATVSAALSAGKGVVLLGLAPSALSNGLSAYSTNHSTTDTKLDTSAIASWFGGVTELDKGVSGEGSTLGSAVNLSYFALPTNVDVTQTVYNAGNGDDNNLGYVPNGGLSVNCYQTIFGGIFKETIAFACKEPSGGRLYWQWHYDGFDTPSQPRVAGIFENGCLWAASE